MLTELRPGVFRLEIPMIGPLKSVNCYFLRGPGGWALIDCGHKFPGCKQMWHETLSELGISFADIKDIVVTHSHFDHLGMAGWLQQKTGAPVYMSDIEYTKLIEVQDNLLTDTAFLRSSLVQLGISPAEADQITTIFAPNDAMISPRPQVTQLVDNQITLAGVPWEVIITLGHTFGQICLFNREQNLLLAGDQVLPDMLSVIRFPNDSDDNPLAEYIASLRQLERLGDVVALPAHGGIIEHLSPRIAKLIDYHLQRLEIIIQSIKDGHNQVGSLIDMMFGSGLDYMARFLAIGEITAYMIYLTKEQRILTFGADTETEPITFALMPAGEGPSGT